MTSGGRGLSREVAETAAESGLGSVSISLDGGPETHDALRGVDGAHRAALEAFRHLRRAGIAVAANTQVNRRNIGELHQIFETVADNGCHGWQVFLTVPMGRASDTPELLLQPSDLLDLMPKLEGLFESAKARGIRLLPGNNVGYFGPSEYRLRRELRSPLHASCSAGRSTLGIEANGDIKGCPSLTSREWVGGNVRAQSLVDIWERSPKLRTTRDMTVENHLWGFCRTCYYAEACMGGCTWTASALFGKPGNNPYCHHRVLDFRERGLRERIVRVESPPGEAFDHGLWSIVVEPIQALTPPADC
jgi:radical SAM protein with 4Fe4S-binding SPASM domain